MSNPVTPSPAPLRRLAGQPGVTEAEVFPAADALLREGLRPTTERVRVRTGGSPNTVNPILDRWWKLLGQRLQVGPAALHRLPEPVLRILEGLYVQLLEDARRQAETEQGAARKTLDQVRSDVQIRSHVLSLREGELEVQLRERTQTLDTLQAQVSGFATLLAQANASKESSDRRAAALEAELADLRTRFAQMIAKVVAARRRAPRAPKAKAPRSGRARPIRKKSARKTAVSPKRSRKTRRRGFGGR